MVDTCEVKDAIVGACAEKPLDLESLVVRVNCYVHPQDAITWYRKYLRQPKAGLIPETAVSVGTRDCIRRCANELVKSGKRLVKTEDGLYQSL